MFSFIRKGRPSFFNRFISLILVLILFIFLNCNFSKKEVKYQGQIKETGGFLYGDNR